MSLRDATIFESLLKKGKPIYVVNKTNPPSIVAITLLDRSGNSKYGAIPPTWVPIDLCALFPRAYLRDSYDVRQYFTKGVLNIVDQAEAEKILIKKDAQEELERIASSKYAGHNAEASMKSLREANKDLKTLGRNAALANDAISEEGEIVQDKVRDICVRLEENSLQTPEALTSLKSIQHTLTEDDLQYIIATVEGSSIKRWAKGKLSETTNEKPNKVRKSKNTNVADEETDEESSESDDASDEEIDEELES